MPSRVVSSLFALSGFAVAILAGLSSGNSALRVTATALGAFVACHVVGTLVGMVAERVVEDHAKEAGASDVDKEGGSSVQAR